MTKITTFNKSNSKELTTQMIEDLAELCAKYGVDIKFAGGSYSGSKLTVKMEINVADEEVQEKARRDEFNIYCYRYGLQPQHYQQQFTTTTGDRYKLIGFSPRRTRYPLRVWSYGKSREVLLDRSAVRFITAAAAKSAA